MSITAEPVAMDTLHLASDVTCLAKCATLYDEAPERAAPERRSVTRVDAELLVRMGHELKTPLGAVLGFASLMTMDASEPLTGKQRRRVELIQQAGQHMLSVITDVMHTALQASAAERDSRTVVDLGAVARGAKQWMEPTAERYEVEIDVVEPISGRVHGESRCIWQVLLNLLSNATKYNRRGGSVRVRQIATDDGEFVGLEVSDTGTGMSKGMLARLFSPFDRLGAERSDIEGTGIGLCIVRGLVERLGGRIEVRSQPGVGTAFSIWFRSA